MRPTERMRDRGNEQRSQPEAEKDTHVSEDAAGAGDDDVRHRGVEKILNLRIGREKTLQDPDHLVELRRVGAEETEQIPEEEKAGRERED